MSVHHTVNGNIFDSYSLIDLLTLMECNPIISQLNQLYLNASYMLYSLIIEFFIDFTDINSNLFSHYLLSSSFSTSCSDYLLIRYIRRLHTDLWMPQCRTSHFYM